MSRADGHPELHALTSRALAAGTRAFGSRWAPTRRAVAPGRIELIGNHTDYNGGPVLAAAIDRFVTVLAAPAAEMPFRAAAADAPGEGIAEIDPGAARDWHNAASPPRPFDYLRGAIAAAQAREGVGLGPALDLAIAGDVPLGFGLSSSAALCVALTLAIAADRPADVGLVLAAQEAEHRAGTPCGTMDQSASVAGGVIRFDGATLAVERLAPNLGDLVFAVADSGVERSLGASSYPLRVTESRAGLAHARSVLGRDVPHVAALEEADLAEIQSSGRPLPEVLLRRLRHVVTETARVNEAFAALRAADWERFGALMTASGRSSATDYEISHPRVEELVSEALAVDGVLGARMMGGGEGGAVLALVRRDALAELETSLSRGYFARHGMRHKSGLVVPCAFAPGATVEALP